MQQLTDEWFQARLGKVTASRVHDIVSRTKTGGKTAGYDRYMAEIVLERVTGQPLEGYTNAAMQWGVDTEPQARAAYELETFNQVEEVGMILHPNIADCGASPDGIVTDGDGFKGCLEIKCPQSHTHLKNLRNKTIDPRYYSQVQWQMACCQVDWCDFVSFDPRFPDHLRMVLDRVPRDDVFIKKAEDLVVKFLEEVEKTVSELLHGQ